MQKTGLAVGSAQAPFRSKPVAQQDKCVASIMLVPTGMRSQHLGEILNVVATVTMSGGHLYRETPSGYVANGLGKTLPPPRLVIPTSGCT